MTSKVRQKSRAHWQSRLIQAGFVAGVLLLWQIGTMGGQISRVILPPPATVATAFLDQIRTLAFVPDILVTLYELVVAFGIASILGITAGYFISRSPFLVRVFDPLFAGIYSIPAILFFPLFVLSFGLGPASKIAMGVTISFFPIVMNTTAGFANVDRVLVTAARSMGASSYHMLRWILIPAAMPVIFTGLRIGFILALLAIIGSEALASFAGLGHRIVYHLESMNTDLMYAYIVLTIIVAVGLNLLVSYVERRAKDSAHE